MNASLPHWVLFNAFVLTMLALDLGVFHRRTHEVGIKEALTWSAIWVALAIAFNVFLYFHFNKEVALQFTAAYLIEKSLSVDNVFIFLMIFSHFATPLRMQHRVLFWGILGALAMRALFIFSGFELLHRFSWLFYVFGTFLLISGIRIGLRPDVPRDLKQTMMDRFIRRIVPIPIADDSEEGLFVRRGGRLYGTRLLMALLTIEFTDIVFAVDSIPAVLAITPDPFVVYTSNVFALLGLRSLYFALAGLEKRFRYLRYGLAAILVLVGAKMILRNIFSISTWLSLTLICGILMVSIGASLAFGRRGTGSSPE